MSYRGKSSKYVVILPERDADVGKGLSILSAFTGKLLRVDLTAGLCDEEEWPVHTLMPGFLGGSGLGAKYLWDEVDPSVDPLGPENRLYLFTGALTGSGLQSCCRFEVTAKSPLTGILGEANCGGFWGPELKFAGFDGVILMGISPSPVYLWVHNGKAELRPAEHLWGTDTIEATARMRDEVGEARARVVCIGQAGENRVAMAGIIDDEGRTAARTGLGAVMGSKRVKGIIARGKNRLQPEAKERFTGLLKRVRDGYSSNVGVESLRKYGTAGGVEATHALGDMPIKNWSVGAWTDGAQKLSGVRMAETIGTGNHTCYACPISCKRDVVVPAGPYATPKGHGPEYETVAAFGSGLLNDDIEVVARANYLCTLYGLDTISCGAAVAMAVEAFEAGLLTEEQTGGLQLTWGNAPAHLTFIEQIGHAEGLGELFGRGTRAVSQVLGPKSEEMAIHVKGLELPYHDPRAHTGLAANYATSNRGACHLQSLTHQIDRGTTLPELGITQKTDRFAKDGHVDEVVKTQQVCILLDSLGLCRFPFGRMAITLTDMAEGMSAVTGDEWTVERLMTAAERIFQLKRAWNVRAGVRRANDTLPKRVRELALEGGTGGYLPDVDRQLDGYYSLRGWNEEGIPRPEVLERLGLTDVAERLHA
jgi:aldehyde:ferredoxin oxidoreductase